MPNRRSRSKLEERAIRKVAFSNSKVSPEKELVRETCYNGTEDQFRGEVLALLKDERQTEIPEVPQGLVLTSPYGDGFLDAPLS